MGETVDSTTTDFKTGVEVMAYVCSNGKCTKCGNESWVTPVLNDAGQTELLCYTCYRQYKFGDDQPVGIKL